MTPIPAMLGVADHAGWAHLLGVAAPTGVPAVVERRRVSTIDAGLPTMPYHHESLGMPEGEADALIARVRRSIADCSTRVLREVITDLASSYRIVGLSIREPSVELPDTVAVVRQSYQLQCAADGAMYTHAFCQAARALGLEVHLCRRGEETALAAARLEVPHEQAESFVRTRGRPQGPPWAEEHRRAYAAAIAALAMHAPLRVSAP